MPRRVDLNHDNVTDRGERRLSEPVFGRNETDFSDLSDVNQEALAAGCSFWAQFSVKGRSLTVEEADAAHAWLSENSTGPWNWDETWENHGHFLTTRVYVERKGDRDAFHAAFAERFDRHGWAEGEVMPVARLRGVVAPPSEDDSIAVWTSKRRGFEGTSDAGNVLVTFASDHVRRGFVERYGDAFASETRDGVETFVVPESPSDPQARPARVMAWLSSNSAVGCLEGGPGRDGEYEWRIPVPDPDVREAFAERWGDRGFSWDEARGAFVAADLPTREDPAIPEDFLAYLRGDREDYEAPYAPASAPAP